MIELRGVTVRYGATVAVDDVSLAVPTGTIHGLLGRNGSGKTSLLSADQAYGRLMVVNSIFSEVGRPVR